jgi:hypothetical protein
MGDLNTPLSLIEQPDQKINKDILELNNTMDEMDLTDIYRVFHPKIIYFYRRLYIFVISPLNFLHSRP